MQLTAIGLNHQTAPLNIRERLAFAAAVLPEAVASLAGSRAASEAVILSTCNRTELYCIGQPAAVIDWLAQYHQLERSEIAPYLYTLGPGAAVRHAFRVACGLDSMVLGEPQILGQLKEAVRVAQQQHAVHGELNALFQKTFAVAKEVRSNTAVGENSVSMAAASVKMVEQIFPAVADLNVLFVGAGEMIELVATYFAAKQPQRLTVLNRTLARAEQLCRKLDAGADARLLTDLPEVLHHYDVVVSSTASPLPIIGKGMVERALKARRNQPMLLVDIAVPRDIEPEVGKLANAYLYSVDDLHAIIQSNLAQRKAAAVQAESIVQQESTNFMAWLRSQGAVETIRDYRSQADQIRAEMEAKALAAIAQGANVEQVIHELAHKLTNRLIHAPTKSLQQAAGDGDVERLQLLRDSLGLDQH